MHDEWSLAHFADVNGRKLCLFRLTPRAIGLLGRLARRVRRNRTDVVEELIRHYAAHLRVPVLPNRVRQAQQIGFWLTAEDLEELLAIKEILGVRLSEALEILIRRQARRLKRGAGRYAVLRQEVRP